MSLAMSVMIEICAFCVTCHEQLSILNENYVSPSIVSGWLVFCDELNFNQLPSRKSSVELRQFTNEVHTQHSSLHLELVVIFQTKQFAGHKTKLINKNELSVLCA